MYSRLSTVDNGTFSAFPELSRLNLAGNRLTSTFRQNYFATNQYLSEIWLGDNPWRCDCERGGHAFFLYITERPARVILSSFFFEIPIFAIYLLILFFNFIFQLKDRSQLRCYSSLHGSHGVLWEVACSDEWDGTHRRFGAAETVWTMAIVILILVSVLYAVVYGVKLWLKCRRDLEEDEQRQENLETSRNLYDFFLINSNIFLINFPFQFFPCRMRHNEMVLEREGQPNAPNPRESHPPCYADAILMPRLKASFTSLKLTSLASSDNLMRRAAKRTRSEEILGAASLDLGQRPILVARSQKKLDNWMKESSQSSTVLAKNDATTGNDPNEVSFEIIPQFETEDGHSPYAKRKPCSTNVCYDQSDFIQKSLCNEECAGGDLDTAVYQNQNIPHTSQSYFSSVPEMPPPSPPSLSSFSSFSSSSSVDSNNYIILPQRRCSESHYANV